MKNNSRKYIQITAYLFLIFIFIILIGIARDCSKIQTVPLEGNSGGDTIDIAMIYAPGSYYSYHDTLGGINYQISKEFENAIKKPIKIWPITEPADGMAKLENGSYDILASLPLDNHIKNRFPVSESVFLDRLVLVQLEDSSGNKKVNSSLDLNGNTVYVVSGSSAAQRMKNLAKEIGGDIKIIEKPELSDELLTLQVVNGTVPLAVVNEKVAQKISQLYPKLKYDSSVSFTQFQVWLFNQNDTVDLIKFNEWFDEFSTTDKYHQIINSF